MSLFRSRRFPAICQAQIRRRFSREELKRCAKLTRRKPECT